MAEERIQRRLAAILAAAVGGTHVTKWMPPRELCENRSQMSRAERQWGCYPQEPAQVTGR